MRIPEVEELIQQTQGKIVAIHGEPESGKTTTALQTSPEPVLLLHTEQRNVITSLECITTIPRGNQSLESWHTEVLKDWLSRGNKIVNPNYDNSTVEDMREFFDLCYQKCKDKTFPYKTIIIDTFSYWINIIVMNVLQKEYFMDVTDKANKRKETINRSLTEQFQIDQRQYGSLANMANSIMSVIKPLSQFNVLCLLIFQSENNPSFNKTYEQAPYVKGAAFMKDFAGQADYIGVVKKRYSEDGTKLFPPFISFDDPRCLTKWCGERRKDEQGNYLRPEGLMNIKKIFGYE